jgi:hypothetical protein
MHGTLPKFYGFVYIWRDRSRKMFYVGSHMGEEDDGYICSSRTMLKEYRERSQDFKRRIIYRIAIRNVQALLEIEQRWVSMITRDELCVRYYNRTTNVYRGSKSGRYLSMETRRLISIAHEGIRPGPETREKMRKAKIGTKRTLESRQKQGVSLKGRKRSQEAIEKTRLHFIGKKQSEEHLKKLSAARKGKKQSAKTVANRKAAMQRLAMRNDYFRWADDGGFVPDKLWWQKNSYQGF